jgi:hypothetical protein
VEEDFVPAGAPTLKSVRDKGKVSRVRVDCTCVFVSVTIYIIVSSHLSTDKFLKLYFLFRVSDLFEVDERSLNDFLPLMLVLIRYGG